MQVLTPGCRELDTSGKDNHGHYRIVTIGEESPHSCRLLSYLAPRCPTTIPLLPETVRSGTGSVNPKPPAHGALAGSNQPWFLQGTRCDDPKTIEPVSAPNWHRFFDARSLDEPEGQKLGRPLTKNFSSDTGRCVRDEPVNDSNWSMIPKVADFSDEIMLQKQTA